MNFAHVNNNMENGIAEILIYDEIGQSTDSSTGKLRGISGTEIAREINMLNDFSEVKQINVRINSSGGSVLEGYSIFMAIKNSSKPVHTFIDGVGASISGIIFQAGDKRSIVDFGRLMIHDPSTPVNSMLLNDKQQRMLKSFRDSLLTILGNNSKLDETTLSNIMTNETWITPNEAVEQGLADDVINTGRVFNELETATTPESIMAICNNLYLQKSEQMKDVKNHLGIDANATESTVLESIKTIQNELTTATNDVNQKNVEIENLTNSIATKETEIEAMKVVNDANVLKLATIQVENAISKGLFDESKKVELIEKCKNDMDGFVSLLGLIKSTPIKVTDKIENTSGKPAVTLRDLEKNNPNEVQRLMNHEPEVYKSMYLEQYGVAPKN